MHKRNGSGSVSCVVEEIRDEQDVERDGWQWGAMWAMLVLFVVIPPLVWTHVSAWVLLVGLLVATFAIGVFDGRTYRMSGDLGGAAGGSFLLGLLLYFNGGAWIYIPVVVLLAGFGAWVGAKLQPARKGS